MTAAADSVVAQIRALFFVFDGGTGVGHLRRLSRIARKLQGRFSCLIVTGQRAAAHWFVPEECEYVHLPSWDSLLESRARYWDRQPFITVGEADAVGMRRKIIHGVVEAFAPDVIFVDHLPLGAREELTDVIHNTPCRKYLVSRGLLNETEDLRKLILGGGALGALKAHYDKLLIAMDSRVFDFTAQYSISSDLRGKTFHTGYVVDKMSADVILKTRSERSLAKDDIWVVVSAGGGQLGEALIDSCVKLARTRREAVFDIVVGPRSRYPWESASAPVIVRDNVRLHRAATDMAILHASADLVISTAGYNSILETLQGHAKLLCFPFRTDKRDEQYRHAVCLKPYVDLDVSNDLRELPMLFTRAIESRYKNRSCDRRGELNFDGAANIESIVLKDVGLRN